MKISSVFAFILFLYVVSANDAPGFFLKTTKNIPRLGKRVFIKQGPKNIPRLGRRSETRKVDDLKNYNHVQPIDSKFIFDFLSDEFSIAEGDLKFLSWKDLDKALESDSALKQKLSNIARDNEMEELRKFAEEMNLLDEHGGFGDQSKANEIFQQFIPYENQKNGRFANDAFYYYTEKRNEKNEHLPKRLINK